MPPKKVNALLNLYGQVEIVNLVREFPDKKRKAKDDPFYGAFAIISTGENEFVFQRQSYDQPDIPRDDWMVPGGGVEGLESFEEATIREVWEETGIRIAVTGLYKIFHHTHVFVDGVNEWYLVVFFADAISVPEAHHSTEVSEVRMFRTPPENLMGYLSSHYRDLCEKHAVHRRKALRKI